MWAKDAKDYSVHSNTTNTLACYMYTFVYEAHKSQKIEPTAVQGSRREGDGCQNQDEEARNKHDYGLCIVNRHHTCRPTVTRHPGTWSSANARTVRTGPLSLSWLKRTLCWDSNMVDLLLYLDLRSFLHFYNVLFLSTQTSESLSNIAASLCCMRTLRNLPMSFVTIVTTLQFPVQLSLKI